MPMTEFGEVIAVGTSRGRWMYATRIDDTTVRGRMWSARKKQWTKTEDFYARTAIGKKRPNCPKPSAPKD